MLAQPDPIQCWPTVILYRAGLPWSSTMLAHPVPIQCWPTIILYRAGLPWSSTLLVHPVPLFLFFTHFYFPASGQAVVTGVVPSPPRFLPSTFIAPRVQQSHCSSIFHRVLLTHALEPFASQFMHKKKSPRIYTSMHSGGFELTKLTYSRLEDSLVHHRGDRYLFSAGSA